MNHIRPASLQIKCASLAAESRLIRKKEKALMAKLAKSRQKAVEADFDPTQWKGFGNTQAILAAISGHRRHDLRREARASHLAYGFLRGRAYNEMERTAYLYPDFGKVESIAKRFADADWRQEGQRFAQWKDAAAVRHPGGALWHYNDKTGHWTGIGSETLKELQAK